MRVGAVHTIRHNQRTHTREQRPEPVIHREQVCRPAAGGNRNRDLAREGILGQQVEEDLEQAAVCRTIDRRAHDDDSGLADGAERGGNLAVFAPAQQTVCRELSQIDESSWSRALPLECRQRQLEQRARA